MPINIEQYRLIDYMFFIIIDGNNENVSNQ
jgi:hypothetical protein